MKLSGKIDPAVSAAVRAITKTKWDSSLPELLAYRRALMKAQDRCCVYCTRRILRDELGHRELDHILPKSKTPSKNFCTTTATSNAQEHRRHTNGYNAFRYEPENLAVSCKRCNSFKGAYDGLANRLPQPSKFPASSNDYEWVHPHYDTYSRHIKITKGLLYVAVKQSAKGKAVIHACGLDHADELTKRVVEQIHDTNRGLVQEMIRQTIDGDPIDRRKIAKALHVRFQIATPKEIAACLMELQGSLAKGPVAITGAMSYIMRVLGIRDEVFGPKTKIKLK